jgi:hypothetical protein
LGRHRLVVVLGDDLADQLESIARKKGTSVEDLLRERVIPEWIGKRRIVSQRVFEESRKRPRRANNRHRQRMIRIKGRIASPT